MQRQVLAIALALTAAVLAAGQEAAPLDAAREGRGAPAAAPPSLFFSCDIQGRLTPCACEEGPLGGVARMGMLFRQWATERPSHVIVDVGNATVAEHPNAEAINRLAFEALDALGCVVANCGDHEAAQPLARLARALDGRRVRMISANLVRVDTQKTAFPPHHIVERGGRRIAFIGLLGQDVPGRTLGPGLRVLDPGEALKSSLEALRGQAELVVVLAYLAPEALYTLARRCPEVPLFLGGRARATSAMCEPSGNSLIAYLGDEGCTVGRIDGLAPRKGRAPAASGQVALLDSRVADDPPLLPIIATFREAVQGRPPGADWDPRVPCTSSFVGADVCKLCHVREYFNWQATRHAGAYVALLREDEAKWPGQREYARSPACLRCHATGFGLPGGYDPGKEEGPAPPAAPGRPAPKDLARQATLKNVGCESCHGGARRHLGVAIRMKFDVPKAPQLRSAAALRTCVRCHSLERPCHEPGTRDPFDQDEYLQKIKHWP